jgi:hypothetical protein
MQTLGAYQSDSEESTCSSRFDSEQIPLSNVGTVGIVADVAVAVGERESTTANTTTDTTNDTNTNTSTDTNTKNSSPKRSKSPTKASPKRESKRKFEPFIPEIIDETRGETVVDKVYSLMHQQGALSLGLPMSIRPDAEDPLQQKIQLWIDLREKGLYFNERLLNTHEFCNPLIMDKMISYMELDQYGTNLDEEELNPTEILSLPSFEQLST